MRSKWFSILFLGLVLQVSCDRPAATPTAKQVIEASEASRLEVEKKLEEQRLAIKAALGESAPATK